MTKESNVSPFGKYTELVLKWIILKYTYRFSKVINCFDGRKWPIFLILILKLETRDHSDFIFIKTEIVN